MADTVHVPDWWDVFTFDDEPVIDCPDCDTQSPPLRDIYAAARWVKTHYSVCVAPWDSPVPAATIPKRQG